MIALLLLFTLHTSCCNVQYCFTCTVFEALLLATCLIRAAFISFETSFRSVGLSYADPICFIPDTPVRRKTLLLD